MKIDSFDKDDEDLVIHFDNNTSFTFHFSSEKLAEKWFNKFYNEDDDKKLLNEFRFLKKIFIENMSAEI